MKKTLALFYFLLCYAIMQFVWWGYMLISFEPDRKGMIIGEGLIFLMIFFVGALKLKNQIVKEHERRSQQNNFLLSITHELKSPLASIKLYLQTILKRDLDRTKKQTFLMNSLKDIERLDDLVENVLLVTKLEGKGFSLPKEELNFTELIREIAGRLQMFSCDSQVIRTDLVEDAYLLADRFAITNVVTNLIENAIKYSPPCANVYVLLKQEEGKLIFAVADHGVGISDEEKKLIFNKFYRVGSESTRKTKGTGLGLFIVRSVLQKHNATIKVMDNEPSGSIFEITFYNVKHAV